MAVVASSHFHERSPLPCRPTACSGPLCLRLSPCSCPSPAIKCSFCWHCHQLYLVLFVRQRPRGQPPAVPNRLSFDSALSVANHHDHDLETWRQHLAALGLLVVLSSFASAQFAGSVLGATTPASATRRRHQDVVPRFEVFVRSTVVAPVERWS